MREHKIRNLTSWYKLELLERGNDEQWSVTKNARGISNSITTLAKSEMETRKTYLKESL